MSILNSNTTLKVEQIEKTFSDVKKVGIEGQELANKVLSVYILTKEITSGFEKEKEEQDIWMKNFATFAGEDGLVYAQQVYAILKEAELKLEQLG